MNSVAGEAKCLPATALLGPKPEVGAHERLTVGRGPLKK